MANKKIIEQLVTELTADGAKMRKELDKTFKDTKSWGDKITGVAKKAALGIAAGGATMAVGLGAAIKDTIALGREVTNLSALSGTSTTEFQRFAYAAKSLGLEGQDVGDILKDVSDKVGDFIQTGAGPMADFFENIAPLVGVTAEQFRDLSGRDALQLYVSSLEKANLSQSEMTFFMEAIASDATKLLPLLKNNGAELERLGNRAQDLGAVLSEVELKELTEIDKAFTDFGVSVDGLVTKISVGLLPSVKDFTEVLNAPETQEGLASLADGLLMAAKYAVSAGVEVGKLYRLIAGFDADNLQHINEQIKLVQEALDSPTQRLRFFGKDGIVTYYSEAELNAEMEKLVAQRDKILLANPPPSLVDASVGGDGLDAGNPKIDPAAIKARKEQLKQDLAAKKASEKAAADLLAQEKQLTNEYLSQSDSYRRSLTLVAESTELQKLHFEIAFGGLRGINKERREELELLARQVDAQTEANIKAEERKEIEDLLMTDVERINKLWDERIAKIKELGLTEGEATAMIAKAEAQRGDELKNATKEKTDEMSEFTKQAARNMQSAFADFLFDPFEDGLDGMLKSFSQTLLRMAAEAAAAQIFNSIGAWGAGNAGAGGWVGTAASFASMFGGAFAEGGRPPMGKISVVGDGGEPELFVPDTAGTIVPFSKLGGGGTSVSVGSMVFPGITNASEAKRAAGAAGRELLSVMSAAQRYA